MHPYKCTLQSQYYSRLDSRGTPAWQEGISIQTNWSSQLFELSSTLWFPSFSFTWRKGNLTAQIILVLYNQILENSSTCLTLQILYNDYKNSWFSIVFQLLGNGYISINSRKQSIDLISITLYFIFWFVVLWKLTKYD